MQTNAAPPFRVVRRRCRIACWTLGLLLAAGAPAARAQSCPAGVWTFVAESSGATADVGTIVTLTFGGATATFVATGPGRTLTADGPCSATANRITMKLPAIGKSAAQAPFTLSGGTLTLPFNVFSDAPGTSTWHHAAANGGSHPDGSAGSGTGATGGAASSTGSGSDKGATGSGGTGSGSGNGATGSGGTGSGSGSGAAGSGGTASGSTGGGASGASGSGAASRGGHSSTDDHTHANPYAPYVGDWVGSGWSYETRFRQSRQQFVSQLTHGLTDPLASREGIDGTVMELIVQHHAHFVFTIDASGHVTGKGGIVYNLVPNLCGLAALTKQANESINLSEKFPSIYKFANELGTTAIKSFVVGPAEREEELSAALQRVRESFRSSLDVHRQREVPISILAKGASVDSRTLALQTILLRCGAGLGYKAVNDVPCSQFTTGRLPPALAGLLAFAEPGGQLAQEKLFDKLNDLVKGRMAALNHVEKHEELSCGQVGPATLAQMTAQMKEQFKDLLIDQATGLIEGGGLAAAATGDMMAGVAGLSVPVNMLLNIPGVTQVTYWYRGLVDGPDKSPQAERQFDIDGHIEVNGDRAKLYLNMGQLTGGPSQLTIEYMVNFQQDQGHFPAFSPFLDQPGDVTSSTVQGSSPESTGIPTATFHAAGTHRNGVAPWQEYEYNWVAHRVTAPITEQPR